MPLLNVFFAMLWFFLFVIWLMLLFRVFGDIFRTHDMGGFAKTVWILFVIFFPFLGVFVYLIANGKGMAERDMEAAKAQDAAMKAYVQSAAGTTPSVSDELAKLAALRDNGTLSPTDYEAAKAKVLA